MDDNYEYIELNVPTTVWKRIEGLAALSNPPITAKQFVYDLLNVVAQDGTEKVRSLLNILEKGEKHGNEKDEQEKSA